MALYLIPLLVLIVVVLFLRRAKAKKKTGPSEEEYLAQVLQEVKQAKEEPSSATEQAKVIPPEPFQAGEENTQPQPEPAPAPKPQLAKAQAPAKPRFTPSSPLIKQYETHLNLEMIRAEKAGDETAYIDIVRINAIYMKTCSNLKKALEEKNKEKALEALKKIRSMIPRDFG